MLKRFFRDSVLYGASALISRGISLALLPVYTRFFSPHDYGVIDIMLTVAAAANLVVALEVSQGLARHFADTDDPAERVRYASSALWFTALMYGLFCVSALVFAPELGAWLLEDAARSDIIAVAALAITANGMFYLFQNQLRWQLRPGSYAAASVAFALVTATTTVFLVVQLGMGVLAVFWGQLAGATVGSAIAWFRAREVFVLTMDGGKLRDMLRFSAPLVPSGVAVFVSLYIDRIAIKQLLTLADVGVFGVGYRIASIAGILLLGVPAAVTPLVYANHRSPDMPDQLASIFRLFLAALLIPLLLLAVFARDIILFVTTAEYVNAYTVVPLLAAATLLSQMYVFAPGLALKRRTAAIAWINVLAAAVNTVLNFVLIPVWGIVGAAAATVTGALLAFSLYMFSSQRMFHVPHRWPAIGAAVAVCVGIIGVGAAAGAPTWHPVQKVPMALLGVVGILALLIEGSEARWFLLRLRSRIS